MNIKGRNYLITGGAGFIGSSVAKRLLSEGGHVVILDNLTTDDIVLLKEYYIDKYDLETLDDEKSDRDFEFPTNTVQSLVLFTQVKSMSESIGVKNGIKVSEDFIYSSDNNSHWMPSKDLLIWIKENKSLIKLYDIYEGDNLIIEKNRPVLIIKDSKVFKTV